MFAFPALLALSGVTCKDTSLGGALLLRLVGEATFWLMGFQNFAFRVIAM